MTSPNQILLRDSNYIVDGVIFNSLGQALGIALKFCTSVAKRLKLEVRKFWGLILMFVEVKESKS